MDLVGLGVQLSKSLSEELDESAFFAGSAFFSSDFDELEELEELEEDDLDLDLDLESESLSESLSEELDESAFFRGLRLLLLGF